MNKKKLIAIAIIAFLVILPFQPAYISFSQDNEVLQALSMAVVIIGSIIAILMFNKGAEESNHH